MASLLTLARGKYLATVQGLGRFLVGQAIAAGATQSVIVDVSDFDNITVIASQTGAATGDITLTVQPVEEDGVTVIPAVLPAALAGTAVLSGGHVSVVNQYDLRGLRQVQINVKNNNAGAETVDFVDVLAGITGVDF